MKKIDPENNSSAYNNDWLFTDKGYRNPVILIPPLRPVWPLC
ncbi:MAG: hypothetical protein ACK40M_07975 [Flavobacteriales bacterium]